MSEGCIYLDYAATTPLLPQARAAMDEGFRLWANPSSPHKAGRAARAALEDARLRVKAALGWQGEVVFTSGASEALALAIGRAKLRRLVVSAVEHDAVLRPAGPDALRLPVDGAGLVDLAALAAALEQGPAIVAVQQVNSETGVIQPLDEVAALVRSAGGVLLCDAAQGAGKIALPDADLIALSAHKFGGPIGIGALLVRDFALLDAPGGQERGYRGGTENLPGAMAMAAALEAGNQWLKFTSGLRKSLELQVVEGGGEVVAAEAPRLPAIGAYRMPGVPSAVQLIRFDGMGLAVSAGSACSSGSLRPSHVLTAMAYPALGEVIRVSLGRETTEGHVAGFVAAWREIAGGARA
ncbi:aminotransferase class V-fold PLP-dependent enzyme [Novosphingobium sp. KCTC 2891]|uniref:cysteine desulfurase family protein n=1 Tax=Novosphingobium sp. KCTC 2891 TaxID=2989730 RepID=UPI0022239921|nr:aminotransferase class V-fold PLP-dependent enzyme [Novosphingobium sp. KCTC 2891]MCW1382481.1 aminotransferase class V-fold PLP-dependent enzyme [Novosphingobium sp. KCTC 2891]